MKTLILISLLFTSQAFSGELFWQTNEGLKSNLNCTINAHSHSDDSHTSEYWINCDNNAIDSIITGPSINRSTLYINGEATLICPMQSSIFADNDNFSMMLDCRTTNNARR